MADDEQGWKVYFYHRGRGDSPPKIYVDGLPKGDRESAYKYIAMLRDLGTRIIGPQSKHLTGPLWELCPVPNRLIYWLMPDRCFLILHAFPKKSRKTKKKDIDLALRRMREMKGRLGL